MTLPSHGRHVLIRSWMLLWLNEDRNFHKRIPQLAVIVATHHFIAKQSHNQGDLPPVTVPVVKLLFAAPLGQPLHFVEA